MTSRTKLPLTPMLGGALSLLTALGVTSSVAIAQTGQDPNRPVTSGTVRPVSEVYGEDLSPHVGLMAGAVQPEGSYDAAPGAVLDIGYQPWVPLSAGLELGHYRSSGEGDNEDLSRTHLLAKVAYNFGGETPVIRHSYAGVGAGVVMNRAVGKLASAPMLGFDIPVNGRAATAGSDLLSLGAHAKYMVIEGSDPDEFALLGAVKYWF